MKRVLIMLLVIFSCWCLHANMYPFTKWVSGSSQLNDWEVRALSLIYQDIGIPDSSEFALQIQNGIIPKNRFYRTENVLVDDVFQTLSDGIEQYDESGDFDTRDRLINLSMGFMINFGESLSYEKDSGWTKEMISPEPFGETDLFWSILDHESDTTAVFQWIKMLPPGMVVQKFAEAVLIGEDITKYKEVFCLALYESIRQKSVYGSFCIVSNSRNFSDYMSDESIEDAVKVLLEGKYLSLVIELREDVLKLPNGESLLSRADKKQ